MPSCLEGHNRFRLQPCLHYIALLTYTNALSAFLFGLAQSFDHWMAEAPLRGDADDVAAANLLARYLSESAAGPIPLDARFAAVVVAGSSVTATVAAAVAAHARGAAPFILLSGGCGYSTPLLRAAAAACVGGEAPLVAALPPAGALGADAPPHSEAALMAAVAAHLGAPRAALLLEEASRNCGGNARESLRVLRETPGALRGGDGGGAPPRLLLLQDPTMQRRTSASFAHWQAQPENAGAAAAAAVASHAVFVPALALGGAAGDELVFAAGVRAQCEPAWTLHRYVSLLLGEVPRLRNAPGGYGPKGSGFIAAVDVPADVEAAWARLTQKFGHLLRA